MKKRLFTLVVLLVFLGTNPVFALTSEQKRAIDSGARYFNTESTITCITSGGLGSANLVGGPNIEKIFNFFVQKGMTPEQAAGIAGNAQQESSGDPLAGSKKGAFQGIFQWDKPGRWKTLASEASAAGKDPNDLGVQLDFAWKEANQRTVGGVSNIAGVKQQNTVELAAWYWGRFFEGATIGGSKSTTPMTNVQELDKRVDYGRGILAKYGGTAQPALAATPDPANPDPTAATPAEVAPNTSCTGAGQDTQYIDGFTFYNQYDPLWKNKPYGSSTIGESGCGPSAMAMIITSLTGQQITPVLTAGYATEKNLYQEGVGSSWSIAPVLAEHWGLKSEKIGADVVSITAALQAGKLVIAAGGGAVPFTTTGHYIVIRAATADGKWKVGDSAFGLPDHKDANSTDWDPQQIVTSIVGTGSNSRAGSVYAISK